MKDERFEKSSHTAWNLLHDSALAYTKACPSDPSHLYTYIL